MPVLVNQSITAGVTCCWSHALYYLTDHRSWRGRSAFCQNGAPACAQNSQSSDGVKSPENNNRLGNQVNIWSYVIIKSSGLTGRKERQTQHSALQSEGEAPQKHLTHIQCWHAHKHTQWADSYRPICTKKKKKKIHSCFHSEVRQKP